jgi:hypothetical protein
MAPMDDSADPRLAELTRAIRALRDEITQKHKEIQALRMKLLLLRRERNRLQQGPGLYWADTGTPGVWLAEPEPVEGPPDLAPGTLRAAALEVLQKVGAISGETAVPASFVAEQLDPLRGATDRRNFYTTVYVTLLRATQGKEPVLRVATTTGRGRRFYIA